VKTELILSFLIFTSKHTFYFREKKVMRFISILMILVSGFSCETKTTVPSPPSGTIQLNFPAEYSKAIIYGFYKDEQISIDTLILEKGKIDYAVGDKFHTGVYRLSLGDKLFEFFYSDDDLLLEIISNNGDFSLVEKKSKANKYFLAFLEEITIVNSRLLRDSTVEERQLYNQFFKEQKVKAKLVNDFLYKMVVFLDQPDYATFQLENSNKKITEKQYVTTTYFENHEFDYLGLLSTPYYFVCIKNYLLSLQKAPDEVKKEIKKRLLFLSGRNSENQKFVDELIQATWGI
jgi:hypothetical protein